MVYFLLINLNKLVISVSVRFSERQTWQKEKSYSPILFYLSLQDFVLK